MSDGCGFDIFGDLDIAYLIWGLLEYTDGPWIAADDDIKFRKIGDDVVFPIFIAFHVRQRIDGKFHTHGIQYFSYHHFPFFIGEWILNGILFIGRSDADEKFSYSIFSRLFECIYMSKMEWLETTDEQSYFLFHKKILGIK